MRAQLLWIAALLGTTAWSVSGAHHSTRAFYDRDASVEIEGTVTSVSWRNPHVGLTIAVRNDRGVEKSWALEGGAMNTLLRRGFTADSVAIGANVRVAGSPSNRGRNEIYVTNMLLPDGTEVRFGDRAQPLRWAGGGNGGDAVGIGMAGDPAISGEPVTDIFRVWTAGAAYRLRAPLVLTAAARAARDAWNPASDDPALRCDAPGMPNAILNPYPIEIVDGGDSIRIRIEEWDAVRTIHLPDGEPAERPPSSRLGYSTGRWQGDTLIVETTGVDWPLLDDSGTPLSPDAEIVERFELDRAQGRLGYSVSVTDPENLVEPAVWDSLWIWAPGVEVQPFQCSAQ
jgi:hypothetical protein